MKKILKKGRRIKAKSRVWLNREVLDREWEIESCLVMIQMLIPLGWEAIEEELQSEVMRAAGYRPISKYSHRSRPISAAGNL